MRVCLHIQAAIAQRAGVGRYVHTLLPHLAALRGEDELAAFYFDFRRKGSPFAPGLVREDAARWVPGALVQQAWKRFGFPPFTWFADKADVYHFPNFVIPPLPRGPKAVVSIHDAGFLQVPETLEPKNLAYLRASIERTVRRADAILTISETIAEELREAFSLPADRVRTTLLGAPPGLEPVDPAPVLARLQLDRPFLLHVGTMEPRKNHRFLFEIFDRLDGFDGDLVLSGMPGWQVEPILARLEASPKRGRIRRLGYVDDSDLAALYQRAEALVFPSLYEGYGLPPVEAMRLGCPVLCSDRGSLPEVVGDGALVLSLDDPDAWVAALIKLWSDPNHRQDLADAGRRRAAAFSWEACARETWDVYRSLGA